MVRVGTRRKICNELRSSLCNLKIGKSEVAELYSQLKSSIDKILLDHPSEEEQEDVGNGAKFLARLMPLYSHELSDFPDHIKEILDKKAHIIPCKLRIKLTKLLIFFEKRKVVDILWNLALFIKLQTLGDRVLKRLTFKHVFEGIIKVKNRHSSKFVELQNILFSMMQQEEDEAKARRSLAILTCLYRGYIIVDDRTTNAICNACFHQSSWVMYIALSFLLDYDEMSIERDDSEDDQPNLLDYDEMSIEREDSEDDQPNQPILEDDHDGASSSEKKRQEKLLGNIRRKREDILLCTKAIKLLKDPQGFTVRLLSRLQSCTERFEIKLMMMEVISQVVRTHSLVLLDLYSYFQKYVQSNEQDIKYVLEAVVWTCHEKVPPEKVKPLLKQILERSLRSCRADMLVGLNVVCRICTRMPLLITEDLLQNIKLGMNLNNGAAIRATRGLIVLLREVCPSLDDGSKQVHNEIFEQILGRLQYDASSSEDDDVSHLFSRGEEDGDTSLPAWKRIVLMTKQIGG